MSKRPDITVFLQNLSGGGAERVAVTLCNAFADQGKNVHLVLSQKKGPYWDKVSPKVHVICLEKNLMIHAILPLARYLRRKRPRVLLCFLTHANTTGLLANLVALNATRVVISERAVFSYFANRRMGLMRRIAIALPYLYRLAERVICVSQGVADDLHRISGLPHKNMAVIYNPTVRDELYRLKDEQVDHPWFGADQPPVLLAVGAFRPEKNYRLMLDAFANIDPRYNARLLILGDGDGRTDMQAQIRRLGLSERVDLPGFKSNPYAYMAKASAFIMCSDSEGLPNALIEALACGCPVIATDCIGGMREIIENQKYGLLVSPNDAQQLCNAMNETLANREAAKKKVSDFQAQKLSQFTPEKVIPEYMRVLRI